jgi:RNA polymerase sigma-70 factor (ECF subfamily)
VEDYEGIFEGLVGPMESRMMRSIWRVVRSPELAEDTLQEALTTIWRKLPLVRRHPNPQALVLKICLNAACDSLRRRKRSLRHVEISILSSAPAPSERGAMSALVAKEIEEEVLRAIGRLPRKQALAVLMRVMEGESFEVIAHTLGCSEVTARIHVSKGRARLQKWLAHLNPSAGKEGSYEYGTEE